MTISSIAGAGTLFDDDQGKAERLLLDLADYVYGHTSLKPMSKTLFVISRCLLVADEHGLLDSPPAVVNAYGEVRKRLGEAAPEDDFSFSVVLEECAAHLGRIMATVTQVRQLTRGKDCLGLTFNSLLRGKIESGEGLGTFLTPEEVVGPMVQMLLASIETAELDALSTGGALFGDICGGTGRFVFTLSEKLQDLGIAKPDIEQAARLYDQSRLAVDLARINFVLQDERPRFRVVADSLTDPSVSAEAGRYVLSATNPPFGTGKYRLAGDALRWLPSTLLQTIAATGRSGFVDPAVLFLVRNLDLLRTGGALAIILPDGIARSPSLVKILKEYEGARACGLDLTARVSLPAVTFALGGTVAKTSFLVLRKRAVPRAAPTFVSAARHVGFLKRGNRRAIDPRGNDLATIAEEYGQGYWKESAVGRDWRVAELMQNGHGDSFNGAAVSRLGQHAERIRTKAKAVRTGALGFHVSVLDVDETGLIDVLAASRNQPISRGIACQAGDVLMSCINPRHWRVAVVPEMEGDWSCSPEFLVLRPRQSGALAGWKLALQLHHQTVVEAVRSGATGTSSSRQRVEKDSLLQLELPTIQVDLASLDEHRQLRLKLYEQRLREAESYARLHRGDIEFRFYL